jgi:hypothetical protein
MPPRKSKTKPPSSQPTSADNSADSSSSAHIVRVGPAGWSYPDWAGFVYPSRRAKGFHEATYLAEYFDTIEINTSFYQPPRPEHAAQWLDRVAANPRFVFTAKLCQRFTHDVQSISSSSAAEDERAVRAGFDVLRAAKKLGAVLLPRRWLESRTVTAQSPKTPDVSAIVFKHLQEPSFLFRAIAPQS